MYISCIIPTMNRYDTLKETLDSYVAATVVPDQLIVVDQTIDPNTRVRIEKLVNSYNGSFREVSYYYQNYPSLTSARNVGFQMAKHEIVVCSDDDISVEVDTIKRIEEIMVDRKISMIAGINSRDGYSNSKIGYLFGKKSFKNRKIGHVTKAMLGRFPENPVEGIVDTQWAMGFFFVVRKSLMDRWGIRWDERLTSYAYAEDLDFSYNYYKESVKEGYRCVLSDNVRVEHRVSTEYRTPSTKATRMYVINREYLSYKHSMGMGSRMLTRWCNFGDFMVRLIKNDKPFDVVKAQIICDRHRKEIRKMIIKPEWYEE